MLWAIVESDKLEKTKVQRNIVGVRSLEGLGTLGRLGLEGGIEVLRRGLRFPLR